METWFWILGWLLSILTITGNGLIIFLVCSKRQLRTKTNAFVVALAVADLGVGMTVVPSLFFCNLTSSCRDTSPSSWVKVIRWLFGFASVTNLCSLVLERYIAVVKPLKYVTFMTRRRVIQLISLSWAIPFTLNILPVASLIFSAPLICSIFTWLVMIFLEFCPCFMLIFFVASMVQVVLKHYRAARILAKQLQFNHRILVQTYEKSTVKVMAIVVGLFLLCYGIYLRCSMIELFGDAKQCNDSEYKIPILVLNSAVNPLAYALLKTDIKKELKRFVCIAILKKGDPQLDATSPPRLGFHLTSPPSGKMPVHDPRSPPPSCPGVDTPIFDTITPELATKDARTSTQETPKEEKSLDSGEAENLKERPVQETPNPKDSVDKTPEKEDPSLQELASEEVSKEKPKQETEEAKSGKDELKDQPEGSTGHVLQEDAVKEDKSVDQTEHASQKVPSDKHEGDTSGEQSLQEFEEFDKEKPLQETGGPGKEEGDLSEGKPLQETASSDGKTDSSIKEEALPTQETMNAGKVPFEEIGLDEDKALQETREPSKTQEAESEKTTDVSKNVPSDKHEGDTSGEQSLQDFEEFDKEKPLQETGGPGKEVGDQSEGKPLQETASTEDKTDSSIKDEPLPTQETMSAGKGTSEETGLDKDKALQETREQEAEGENTEGIEKGEDVLPVEDSDETPPKQETDSSKVESDSSKVESDSSKELGGSSHSGDHGRW